MMAAELIVEGQVQGVGFRAFAQRTATILGLTGYVVNLRDGRVKVRAEGSPDAIEELIRDLRRGPPLSQVTAVRASWVPPSGSFVSFEIRYAEFEA